MGVALGGMQGGWGVAFVCVLFCSHHTVTILARRWSAGSLPTWPQTRCGTLMPMEGRCRRGCKWREGGGLVERGRWMEG